MFTIYCKLSKQCFLDFCFKACNVLINEANRWHVRATANFSWQRDLSRHGAGVVAIYFGEIKWAWAFWKNGPCIVAPMGWWQTSTCIPVGLLGRWFASNRWMLTAHLTHRSIGWWYNSWDQTFSFNHPYFHISIATKEQIVHVFSRMVRRQAGDV